MKSTKTDGCRMIQHKIQLLHTHNNKILSQQETDYTLKTTNCLMENFDFKRRTTKINGVLLHVYKISRSSRGSPFLLFELLRAYALHLHKKYILPNSCSSNNQAAPSILARKVFKRTFLVHFSSYFFFKGKGARKVWGLNHINSKHIFGAWIIAELPCWITVSLKQVLHKNTPKLIGV